MENSFGEFLKEKRKEKNLTQKDLAKVLLVTESAVSKWEKNACYPDITLLPKLSALLGVTEHELITASTDQESLKEKSQAKKWRALSLTWSLFFYISYLTTILVCFICNLAINGKLSWFWIVLSSLLLAFTFTSLPWLIKKNKLLVLPLSAFLALALLLGVCTIYTKGDWFFIAVVSVLFGLVIIFVPIYISKYNVFSRIKKYNDFISIGIDFILLNILFVVINAYTLAKTSSASWWCFSIALPISLVVYLFLNILLCVRFLRLNKLFKTGIILTLINLFLYLPPLFVNVESLEVQKEIDALNVLRANFSSWTPDLFLENNIHCIIFLTMLSLAIIFFLLGLNRSLKK